MGSDEFWYFVDAEHCRETAVPIQVSQVIWVMGLWEMWGKRPLSCNNRQA